ncbi:hypothetical protein F8388_001341 [Cannabis sativa]|uniref:RNase H type-1 domain-containing protein n=1 Tax=Cannabis sativa TaxID=3483 RepID=A0A7J6DY22_CANSA|nr:hypothetical protein F8388_001341 [Cannabis sativa]
MEHNKVAKILRLLTIEAWEEAFLLSPNRQLAIFLVDASVLDGVAGIGFVLNFSGVENAITIHSHCLASSVLEAELVAILTATEWAWDNRCGSILIESNSKVVVEALELGELPLAWGAYPVFRKCLLFATKFHVVSFKFIPRELNSLVDLLVSQARVNRL